MSILFLEAHVVTETNHMKAALVRTYMRVCVWVRRLALPCLCNCMWPQVTAHWQCSVNMRLLGSNIWLEPLGSLLFQRSTYWCTVSSCRAGRFPKALFIIRFSILLGRNYTIEGSELCCKPIPRLQILKVHPEAPRVVLRSARVTSAGHSRPGAS